jgi:hypothetical protein
MHQAALLDGPALDALALQQNGLPPAEIDISRGQIVQALVVAPVVIPLDECLNIGLKRNRCLFPTLRQPALIMPFALSK